MTVNPRQIREISTGDPSLDRVQEDVSRRAKEQNKTPFANGVEVDLTLHPGTNIVDHNLGRTPEGYVFLRAQDRAPTVYDTSLDSKRATLVLTGVSSCRAKVWFY